MCAMSGRGAEKKCWTSAAHEAIRSDSLLTPAQEMTPSSKARLCHSGTSCATSGWRACRKYDIVDLGIIHPEEAAQDYKKNKIKCEDANKEGQENKQKAAR